MMWTLSSGGATWTLYQFNRAQRDGIWDLHLHSLSDVAIIHAVWSPELRKMGSSVPSRDAPTSRTCVIRVSKGKLCCQVFCQVDPDQAMEWINGTGKKGGWIIGITKTTSALCRWTLSYNLRSHISAETHAMFNHSPGSIRVHNEATKSRRRGTTTSRSHYSQSSKNSRCISFTRVIAKSRHKGPSNRGNPKFVTLCQGTRTRRSEYIHWGEDNCTWKRWQAGCPHPCVPTQV